MSRLNMADFFIQAGLAGGALLTSAWAAVTALFVGGALSPSTSEEIGEMLDSINAALGLAMFYFVYTFFVRPVFVLFARMREAKHLASENAAKPALRRPPSGPRIAGRRRRH